MACIAGVGAQWSVLSVENAKADKKPSRPSQKARPIDSNRSSRARQKKPGKDEIANQMNKKGGGGVVNGQMV